MYQDIAEAQFHLASVKFKTRFLFSNVGTAEMVLYNLMTAVRVFFTETSFPSTTLSLAFDTLVYALVYVLFLQPICLPSQPPLPLN